MFHIGDKVKFFVRSSGKTKYATVIGFPDENNVKDLGLTSYCKKRGSDIREFIVILDDDVVNSYLYIKMDQLEHVTGRVFEDIKTKWVKRYDKTNTR